MRKKTRIKYRDTYNNLIRYTDVDIPYSDELMKAYFTFQSQGKSKMTESEYESISHLIDAQKWKEFHIEQLVRECAEYWCNGWGFYIPISCEIQREFDNRHKTNDVVMLRALIKLARSMKEDMVDFIVSYTGLTNGEKNSILRRMS